MTSYSASKWVVTGFTPKKWSTYLKHPQNQRKPGRFPQAEAYLPAIRRVIRKDAALVIASSRQKVYWFLFKLFPASLPYMPTVQEFGGNR